MNTTSMNSPTRLSRNTPPVAADGLSSSTSGATRAARHL